MTRPSEIVEQVIDGGVRARFRQETIEPDAERTAISMTRKRSADAHASLPPLPPVLLMHGFGQNRHTFHTSHRSLANYLAHAGFDVFNLDLQARDRVRRWGGVDNDTLDKCIQHDVPAAIRLALQISGAERVFLVGHSMGGLIGYSVAGSSMRDEVAGVVSLATPYRFAKGSRVARALLAPFVYGARASGAFHGEPPAPFRFLGEQLRRHHWLSDNRFVPIPLRPWTPGSMEREVLEESGDAAFEHTRMAVALGLLGRSRDDTLHSQDGLTDYGLAFELTDKPLLVMAGTSDKLAPPASVKPAFEQSRSSDKTYREFPLGHIDIVLGRDAPSLMWPALRGWLQARAQRAFTKAGV